ncbi:MAG: hypothetical protein GEV28_10830 [Actinophytocola sp.]|uniref:hypothetical protein n=1 Tax=Actinophytocola sp. TaxID=1872138 RepID=UPI001329709A|nr:hypothetical protein [Actinophytocola sp.]MPZ80855.1 hypothetical protein [Actinophytocola sp.]
MKLWGRGNKTKQQAAVDEVVARLTGDRCWNDIALDAGVAAVRDGHLAAGLALLRETRDDHELRSLRGEALGEAAVGQSDAIAGLFSEQLPRADAADILVWMGTTLIVEAWRIRGDSVAKEVGEDRFRLFHATLRHARDPLLAAADLVPEDPTPWASLLTYARGMQLGRDEEDSLWRNVIQRRPTHFHAHTLRLQALAAKWGGSHEEMFEFARDAATTAPPGNPLTAILPIAHAEFRLAEMMRHLERGDEAAAISLLMNYFSPEVTAEVGVAERKWSTTAGPHPYSVVAHNVFGWTMLAIGDDARARWHLSRTNERPSSLPWTYEGDEKERFAEAILRLGIA